MSDVQKVSQKDRPGTRIEIGDTVIETTPSGRRIEHEVLALDQPPSNPGADPGPYVKLTDRARGKQLLLKPEDIESAYWLEHVPAGGTDG